MKFSDHLSKTQKRQLNGIMLNLPKKQVNKKKHHKEQTPKPKKDERINWHEMMGANMQTLKRGPGGAMRRK